MGRVETTKLWEGSVIGFDNRHVEIELHGHRIRTPKFWFAGGRHRKNRRVLPAVRGGPRGRWNSKARRREGGLN